MGMATTSWGLSSVLVERQRARAPPLGDEGSFSIGAMLGLPRHGFMADAVDDSHGLCLGDRHEVVHRVAAFGLV